MSRSEEEREGGLSSENPHGTCPLGPQPSTWAIGAAHSSGTHPCLWQQAPLSLSKPLVSPCMVGPSCPPFSVGQSSPEPALMQGEGTQAPFQDTGWQGGASHLSASSTHTCPASPRKWTSNNLDGMNEHATNASVMLQTVLTLPPLWTERNMPVACWASHLHLES